MKIRSRAHKQSANTRSADVHPVRLLAQQVDLRLAEAAIPSRSRHAPLAAADPLLSFVPKIVTIETELLIPTNYARTHTKRQIRQIARSIERFGFTNPILIDDNRQILAGHGRLEAARLLGLRTVPTLALTHLDAAEKRAYVIADNRLAELAGWDPEILAIELQELVDLGFDVELTGFEMAEVDLILEEAGESLDENAPRDLTPPYVDTSCVSQPGDLWHLGNHCLLCGDARNPFTYETLLNGLKAAFVFTDPPYNVPIDGHVCGGGRVRHRDFAMGCGEMDEPEFTAFLEVVFRQLVMHTLPGSIHDICMDWRHMPEMLAAGRAVYTELKNLCVWNKSNGGLGTFYRSKHELVFVWKNGKFPHINNFELGQFGRYRSNVWDYAGTGAGNQKRSEELALHPTVKPVALIADAIKDCSQRGDIVLDPFAGSGTVFIAAERMGRKAYAIEIDPHYVDVAVRRWQNYTGRQAIHARSGLPFEDVETAQAAHPQRIKE